jgi:hypothetical protein
MATHRIVLTATGILGSLVTAGLAQPQELPQTQMAAAAVVMAQMVSPVWSVTSTIKLVDDKSARILPLPQYSHVGVTDVLKIDDCKFEATRDNGSSVRIDLGVLSNEYQQGQQTSRLGASISYSLTLLGTGTGPAECRNYPSGLRCFKDLTLLGPGGAGGSRIMEPVWRAYRALQFLQKYCPPQRLGF